MSTRAASLSSMELVEAADEAMQRAATDHQKALQKHQKRYRVAALADGISRAEFEGTQRGWIIDEGNWRELTQEEVSQARDRMAITRKDDGTTDDAGEGSSD